jgi:hypothetical protein
MSFVATPVGPVNAEDVIPFGLPEEMCGGTGLADEQPAAPEPVEDYHESGAELDSLRNELAAVRSRIMGAATGSTEVRIRRTHEVTEYGFISGWTVVVFFGGLDTGKPLKAYRAEHEDLLIAESEVMRAAAVRIASERDERSRDPRDEIAEMAETDGGPRAA